MSELLTEQDKLRVDKIRQMLTDGLNPYTPLTDIESDTRTQYTITEDTRAAITPKFVSKRIGGIRKRVRLVSDEVQRTNSSTEYQGMTCMVCCKPVQLYNSIVGKLLLTFNSIDNKGFVAHFVTPEQEVKQVNMVTGEMSHFPRQQTGRVCTGCIDSLDCTPKWDEENERYDVPQFTISNTESLTGKKNSVDEDPRYTLQSDSRFTPIDREWSYEIGNGIRVHKRKVE